MPIEDKPMKKTKSTNSGGGFLAKLFRKNSKVNETAVEEKKPQVKCRKADGNIIGIRLGSIRNKNQVEEKTEIPIQCQCCQAVYCGSLKKNWSCNICGEVNQVDNTTNQTIVSNTSSGTVEYIIKSPIEAASDGLLIFCIDISGSMGLTEQLPSYSVLKLDLRQSDREEKNRKLLRELGMENETSLYNQYLPHESRNSSYVSRMECLQMAIDLQLDEVSKHHPHKKVMVVTFSSSVSIIGDGRNQTKATVPSNLLSNYDALFRLGKSYRTTNLRQVSSSKQTLADFIYDINEEGQTALGPALIVSCGIASQVQGSKIIVCTGKFEIVNTFIQS